MSRRSVWALAVAGVILVASGGWQAAQRETIVPREVWWIWTDEGNPIDDAPAGERFFRCVFEVEAKPQQARLYLVCDNAFVAYVNKIRVGSSRKWQEGSVFDITQELRKGRNVLAVAAANAGGPAGLAGWVEIRTESGVRKVYPTDGKWRWSRRPSDGWKEVEFPHERWWPVKRIRPFLKPRSKDDPWGMQPLEGWNKGSPADGR